MITHHQNLTATAVQDIPWLNRLVTTQDSPFAASKGKHSRSSKNFPTVPAIDPRQRGNAEDPRLDADKTKGALLSPGLCEGQCTEILSQQGAGVAAPISRKFLRSLVHGGGGWAWSLYAIPPPPPTF